MRRTFAIGFVLLVALSFWAYLQAAEVMPPKPAQWVNDYAAVLSRGTKSTLNEKLRNFEKETSNQIIVALFQKMQSDSSIEDYTQRVAQSWRVGTKGKNNGAILFIFIQDRNMYIQVGYGLEGALPDALAKRIIENEIKPHFRNGNYDAGVMAGANAILAATRGEYKGTGRTVAGNRPGSGSLSGGLIFAIIMIIFILRIMSAAGTTYGPRRRHRSYGGMWGGGLGGFGGGGGWSSGGGGGGGFSGGGGSFGGGGAGGRW